MSGHSIGLSQDLVKKSRKMTKNAFFLGEIMKNIENPEYKAAFSGLYGNIW